MATVTRKVNGGKWIAIFKNAKGKQQWKTGYSDKVETQRLAQRLADVARRISLGDIDPQAESLRIERAKAIAAHLADYKASLQAAGRSPGYVAYTIRDIELLITFGNVKSASEITKPLVDHWALALKAAGADANKTINRRVSSVQQFLRHLHEVGGVNSYVLKRYPKLATGGINRRRHSRAFDRAELTKLLGDTTPEHRRNLYNFVSKTGLRLNECRQVAPAMFDLKHRTINLPAHVTKAKRDQVIPLHASLMKLVTRLCKGLAADAPMFGKLPTKKNTINNLRCDCKHAGVSVKNVGFHSFRYTFCTLLARENVHPALLQKLARHADLKTTLAFYVHLQRTDEAIAINRL